MTAAGVPVSDQPFTRTGLLGFVGPVSVNEPSGALLCPDSQLLSDAPKFSRILCQGSELVQILRILLALVRHVSPGLWRFFLSISIPVFFSGLFGVCGRKIGWPNDS